MGIKTIGQTLAEIEYLKDGEALRAFAAAEQKSGIKTGVRFRPDGTACLVTLALHPRVRAYVHDYDVGTGKIMSEGRPIEKAEAATYTSLQL